ncbi:synaptic vesicle transporter [Xylogone sp. PMI_703]|nr:synaptic vesicle transporter [Xylogone sp. PMI_703]
MQGQRSHDIDGHSGSTRLANIEKVGEQGCRALPRGDVDGKPGEESSNPALSEHPLPVEVATPLKEAKSSDGNLPLEASPNSTGVDGLKDTENPINMPLWRKWNITLLLAILTLCATFSSSVFSQAILVTSQEYHVSAEVMTLGVSFVVFGFALGPMVWGPLSELYGRKPPLFFGFAIFCIFQVPVAVAKNVQTILVGRFFVGFFGSAPVAVAGGALADIWNPIDRGIAIAIFSASTFMGPALGPIFDRGGFIVQSHLGWRWTAWITLIFASFFCLVSIVVIPETYAPILLQRRNARLRLDTGNTALPEIRRPTLGDIVTRYLLRPMQMLFLEPILLCVSLYQALIYGILYLTFEAYPVSFTEDRGWQNAGVAALPFIGILVGVNIGILAIIYDSKMNIAHKMKTQGYFAPEERLPLMMIGSFLLPAGLFWFGWTSDPHITWVPQVIAGVPIGFGVIVIFMQGLNYIIDVYMKFANSALAANALLRSAFGGAFPLFAVQMFHKLGVNWAASLLGFLTAAMVPIPFAFYWYGAKLRNLSRFKPKAY